MLRKLGYLILLGVLAVTFTACGDNEEGTIAGASQNAKAKNDNVLDKQTVANGPEEAPYSFLATLFPFTFDSAGASKSQRNEQFNSILNNAESEVNDYFAFLADMGFKKNDDSENSLILDVANSEVIVSKDNDLYPQRYYLSYSFNYFSNEMNSPVMLDKILLDNSAGVDYEIIDTYVVADIPALLGLNESRFREYGFICEYEESLFCQKEDDGRVYMLTAGKGESDTELIVDLRASGMR